MPGMGKREQLILDAALSVFTRYGVRRTTMNDIASEAGIARQTLYNAYSSKDEVLKACICYTTDQSLSAIQAESTVSDSLGQQLDSLFQHKVIATFELLQATPDANDIINGFSEAGKQEIEQAGMRFRDWIEQQLIPYQTSISQHGLDCPQLADFIYATISGFKQDNISRSTLLDRLATLKALVMKITGAD